MSRNRTRTDRANCTIDIALSVEDATTLVAVSHHYEQLWGRARHVVVWTTPRRIRRRYRFIVEESNDLEARARSLVSACADDSEPHVFQIPIPDAVSYWGRLLSNVRTKRSRRKLSAATVEDREHLAEKFQRSLEAACVRHRSEVEAALATRRPLEAGWMKQMLSAGEAVAAESS